MRCPSCRQLIDSRTAWKGAANCYFCSEFCADSELPVAAPGRIDKRSIDQDYLDRLQRLLPLRRVLQQTQQPA